MCATLALGTGTGCGSGLDPDPEKQDGSESQNFEEEDLDAAEEASGLVRAYCDGGVSEAQVTGCLSHVTDEDVCAQDTPGKEAAVAQYRKETGDDAIC